MQSVCQSCSQSVSHAASQLFSQSCSLSVMELVIHSVSHAVSQSVMQSVSQSDVQPVSYSVSHAVSLSVMESVIQSVSHAVSQSCSQSVSHAASQLFSQSCSQSVRWEVCNALQETKPSMLNVQIWTHRTRGNVTVIIATWKQSYIKVITACVTPATWVVATGTEFRSLWPLFFLNSLPRFTGRSFGDKYVLTSCRASWQELSCDGASAVGVGQSRLQCVPIFVWMVT